MELPASLVGDEYETPPLQDRCQAHPSFSEPLRRELALLYLRLVPHL